MEKNNFNNRRCKSLQNKGKSINALTAQCCAWTNKNPLIKKGVISKTEEGKVDICGTSMPAKG